MKTTIKKRAVLYTRVGTTHQNNEQSTNDLESQEMQLKNYCKKNKIEFVKVYRETCVSAIGFERAAYSEFLEDLKSKRIGKIDFLIATDFTRLTRDLKARYNHIEFLKTKYSIEFIALEKTLATNPPEENMIDAIFLSMQQLESERRSFRIKEGIKAAKAKKLLTS